MARPVDPKGDLPLPNLQDLAGSKRKSREMPAPSKPPLPTGSAAARVISDSPGVDSRTEAGQSSSPIPKKSLLDQVGAAKLIRKRKKVPTDAVPALIVNETQPPRVASPQAHSPSRLSETDGMGIFGETRAADPVREPTPVIDLDQVPSDPLQTAASLAHEQEVSSSLDHGHETPSSPGRATIPSATDLFQPRNLLSREWVLPNGYQLDPLNASFAENPNLAISLHHACLLTKEVRAYAEMPDEQRLREQSLYLLKFLQATQAGQVDSESRRALNANRLALKAARENLASTSDELKKVSRSVLSLELQLVRAERYGRDVEKERDQIIDRHNELHDELQQTKRALEDSLSRAASAEDKMRVAEEGLMAEKDVVKTLRDDLERAHSRASSLEHRLVELQGSLSKQVDEGAKRELELLLGSDDYKRVEDEDQLRLLRAFASKLALKYPGQRASLLEATDIFLKEFFGGSFPGGPPSPSDDPPLDAVPAFDSYHPAS